MRICYFGIYSVAPVYPRNNNIIRGLRETGVIVDECRVELEESFASRAAVARSPWRMAGFALGLLGSYARLFRRLRKMPRPDLFVVGHPGYFHLHLLKLIRSVFYRGVPIVYDVYIPLYDAIVCDRKFLREGGLAARALHWFEGSVCRNADLCLIDTCAHCDYLADEFRLPRAKLDRVFVGSNDLLFPAAGPIAPGPPFIVLQFGTFIPLHGLDVILRAARLLEAEAAIKFVIVGGGQLEGEIKSLAAQLKLKNVEFRDFVPVEELHRVIAASHLCLGIFGSTEKARRVIPSKAFDTVAVGRAIISGETPAMLEAFAHERDAYFVRLQDPEALARGIAFLLKDREARERIARAGHELYKERFTPRALGGQFLEVIRKHFPGVPGSDTAHNEETA